MKKLFNFKIIPRNIIHEATKYHKRPYSRKNTKEINQLTYEIILEDLYFTTISLNELENITNYMNSNSYSDVAQEACRVMSLENKLESRHKIINKYLAEKLNITRVK